MNMETEYTFDEQIVSDLHKDAYGFRPGEDFWLRWDVMTDDQRQRVWDDLLDTARDRALEEHQEHLRAEAQVEKDIAFMMSTVAGCTREDAVRFLHDQHDTNGDREYLEYCLGVRYGYLSGSLYVGY